MTIPQRPNPQRPTAQGPYNVPQQQDWPGAVPPTPRPAAAKGADAKAQLATLRMTATVGALGLTLAGWGLLARAHAISATQAANPDAAQASDTALVADAVPIAAQVARAPTATLPAATATPAAQGVVAAVAALPAATATPLPTATTAPTATPAPAAKYTLNIVQWVQTQNGDPVAVVLDSQGVSWYVWGPDVERIEQGLEPEYQPQPVNAVSRSRGS